MQPKYLAVLYFLVLLADMAVIAADIPYARFATKPLLMIVLGFFCWARTGGLHLRARNLIFAAIIFSWGGDVLLLFPENFVPGLLSFLTAHALYIAFFLQVRPRPRIGIPEIATAAGVAVYAILLVSLLAPRLGVLKPAVMVYTVVISVMLLSALRAFGWQSGITGRLCVAGALLFVLSDSVLAVEKFHTAFTGAGLLVMLTYGLAQWMIVEGSARYFGALRRK
ncbi:hypothetical protein DLD77_08325 [Chitinophaga alhagiae]|uniref:Lysoplasmalogenase n=1 Tax=Chitinophaga alhagiae TaxID=2203219 RepID=A0ABM6WCH1_9BACT|nr:lysoplasmalogenase [Chitinophaga alhagiae]AWO01704.1 hypothetical protein DLD77_08325 [Chitinophaga alhagiae]